MYTKEDCMAEKTPHQNITFPLPEADVTDTGPGIAEGDLSRIFDPFYTTKELGEGTGLGLAIVQRLVENHGGRVSVETELGEGTAFSVTLPAWTPEETDG